MTKEHNRRNASKRIRNKKGSAPVSSGTAKPPKLEYNPATGKWFRPRDNKHRPFFDSRNAKYSSDSLVTYPKVSHYSRKSSGAMKIRGQQPGTVVSHRGPNGPA